MKKNTNLIALLMLAVATGSMAAPQPKRFTWSDEHIKKSDPNTYERMSKLRQERAKEARRKKEYQQMQAAYATQLAELNAKEDEYSDSDDDGITYVTLK